MEHESVLERMTHGEAVRLVEAGFIEHNRHLWRVLVFYMLLERCYQKSESETEKGLSTNSSRMNGRLLKRKSMPPRRSAVLMLPFKTRLSNVGAARMNRKKNLLETVKMN